MVRGGRWLGVLIVVVGFAACGTSRESRDGDAPQDAGGDQSNPANPPNQGGAISSGSDSGPEAGNSNGGAAPDGGEACSSSLCSGQCVDLQRDAQHCGACGEACGIEESCCEGRCTAAVRGKGAPLAELDRCGRLSYGLYANQGETNAANRLPDFSYAGYMKGGRPIPELSVVETLQPQAGDNRARIQAALDAVGALQPDADGLRGAVLLKAGRYEVGDSLTISQGGVVLRGEGQGSDGTVLVATKAAQHDFISLRGSGSGLGEVAGTRVSVTSTVVPVGSRSFEVESTAGFSVGDAVAVLRTPNQAWIDALAMGRWGWTAAAYAVGHERSITGISGNRMTVDIPIVDTLDAKYGGGSVFASQISGRIERSGVEDLRLVSHFASATDEAHGWVAVRLSRARNSWVRRVTAQYFGYAAVSITNESNFNTVEATAQLDPVSEVTGGRRYSFHVGGGVGNLFQRCFSRGGRHNFVTGSQVAGPNVWLDCLAVQNYADDGPHHRWATGLLFDNTRGGDLDVQNRAGSGTGHGWAGAQTLFWNASATRVRCDAPLGAMNWAIGCVGEKTEGSYVDEPYGWFESHGAPVQPRSLYLQQLQDRLGGAAVEAVTSPAQRSGAVWTQLEAWAGEGRLDDVEPVLSDPACASGLAAGNTCCLASCGSCGGTGCSALPGGAEGCCIGAISRSCAEYPPPCVMP